MSEQTTTAAELLAPEVEHGSFTASAVFPPPSIIDLRMQEATLEQQLAVSNDALARLRLEAEQNLLTKAGDEKALGSNAEARARAYGLAVEADEAFVKERWHNRDLTHQLALCRAHLQNAAEARREREWAIRERLVAALERRGSRPELTDDIVDAALS